MKVLPVLNKVMHTGQHLYQFGKLNIAVNLCY